MARIYDVPTYIENNIKNGFCNSGSWVGDAGLYVRWLHAIRPELKRKEVKELLIKKCQKTVPGYNHYIHYKVINTIMDRNWKREFIPLKVKSITFSQECIDWFVKQNLKKNELKFLFGLYMLHITKLCDSSKEKASKVYDNGGDKMFLRNNTSLPVNISTFNMFTIMEEKGYVNTFLDLANLLFLDTTELKIVMKVEDKRPYEYTISFECGDLENTKEKYLFTTTDLYNFGDKFYQITQNFFTCQKCGRVIEKTVHNRKYCPECAEAPMETKEITCIDCGEIFTVSSKNNTTVRCPRCQKKHNRTVMETREVTCIDCGETFTVSSKDTHTVRCRRCQKKHIYTPMEEKEITCIDCGKVFKVDPSNKRQVRCEECRKKQESTAKDVVIAICERCGKEYEKSGRTRRTICEECYKDQIRQKDAERKRTSRQKKSVQR